LPMQKGAKKVAEATNITHVELDKNSTKERWVAAIGEALTHGFTENVSIQVTESVTITVRDKEGNVVEERTLNS